MFLIYPPPYMVSMLMILQVCVSGYVSKASNPQWSKSVPKEKKETSNSYLSQSKSFPQK